MTRAGDCENKKALEGVTFCEDEFNVIDDQYGSVKGTRADDYIKGSWKGDEISGRIGDDLIFGREGEDTVIGNSGNDVLLGGDGDDEGGV